MVLGFPRPDAQRLNQDKIQISSQTSIITQAKYPRQLRDTRHSRQRQRETPPIAMARTRQQRRRVKVRRQHPSPTAPHPNRRKVRFL